MRVVLQVEDGAGAHPLLELRVLRLDLSMRDLEGLLEAPLAGVLRAVDVLLVLNHFGGVRHLRGGGRIRVEQADAASTPATQRGAG
jgi:hypothetical protein